MIPYNILYDGNSILDINEEKQLRIDGGDESYDYTWSSSNNSIVSVDSNGLVTAHSTGDVIIYATLKDTLVQRSVGLTVYDESEHSDLMNLLVKANSGVILNQDITYIGSDDGTKDYEHNIYGSANDYWAGVLPNITSNMLSSSASNHSGKSMLSIEFIVVHDTAGSSTGSNALANSNWCLNPENTNSSWHYTVGNDGIYQQLPDSIVGYHAGDGATWANSTTLYDTGIIALNDEKPTITIGVDRYYYINGTKTNITAPGTTTSTNTLGIACVIGDDNHYYIPTTYVSSDYGNVLCIRGGNLNGIGIETCVNKNSDVYLTWQYTAKLIARLLVQYDLTPDRVLFHNNFSNKPCPRTMMTANLTDEFLDLVYTEYYVLKNYSDYTIIFTSNNPSILDNTGRVITSPTSNTNVTYTITITKDGVSESMTLNTVIVNNN